MGIKYLDDLGKIRQRPGQPVDLVNDHDIHAARGNVLKQALQSRSLHRPSGEAAVVVKARQGLPPFALLRHDIRFAGFPLGIETVEGLLEPLFGALAGVDRAALFAHAHPSRRPKKRGPLHRVPVISRAISERLCQRLPW